MGYLKNHLATVVTAVFAAILTGLWPVFVDFAPILNFVFMMAVPITWFLAFTCWISQKSADYMKKWEESHSSHQKKNLNNPATTQIYTSEGKLVSQAELNEAKSELNDELNQLRDTVKLQDSEIERLNKEIANLQTRVQIESLKTELANLKMLASKSQRKRK